MKNMFGISSIYGIYIAANLMPIAHKQGRLGILYNTEPYSLDTQAPERGLILQDRGLPFKSSVGNFSY